MVHRSYHHGSIAEMATELVSVLDVDDLAELGCILAPNLCAPALLL